MRIQSFEYLGASFEVQEDTVGSGIDAEYVANAVYPGTRTNREWRHDMAYGAFLATVRLKSGDPGFRIPLLEAPVSELRAFYEVFEDLPRDFRNAYINAKNAVAAPINAPDLVPGIDPNAGASLPTDSTGSSSSPAPTDSLSDSSVPALD